jgi:hypothetical protein
MNFDLFLFANTKCANIKADIQVMSAKKTFGCFALTVDNQVHQSTLIEM